MTERELKEARDAATAYAREHVQELAEELLEWSDSTLLRNGRMRELARILQSLDGAHSLTLARSFAERAVLEQAGRRTTPDREAIIEECRQAALQRSAMLPNDNDFWRGYANGRVDAAGDIARLKTAPNGEKGDSHV
ncbi:hypothetical protein [Burkholderia sp. BCC0398]|uniref:hypothetical protein n=1 Tax=Burkholderia sp. BCC0398 TaxID=2676297 RepID=UPI0015890F27|nr:hypothetical protein [Burkholderia sp. BCC0398]